MERADPVHSAFVFGESIVFMSPFYAVLQLSQGVKLLKIMTDIFLDDVGIQKSRILKKNYRFGYYSQDALPVPGRLRFCSSGRSNPCQDARCDLRRTNNPRSVPPARIPGHPAQGRKDFIAYRTREIGMGGSNYFAISTGPICTRTGAEATSLTRRICLGSRYFRRS